MSDAKCLRGTSSPVSHRLGKAAAEMRQKGEWAAAKEEEEEEEEEEEDYNKLSISHCWEEGEDVLLN